VRITTAALILVTGLGCAGEQPADSLRWQERWELLASLDDGGVLDLDMRVDNLGLLRGQGHVRLSLLDRNEGVLRFSRDYAPVQVEVSPERDALRLGGQGFGRTGVPERWTARIGHALLDGPQPTSFSSTLHLSPEADPTPRTSALASGGQWTVSAPLPGVALQGWIEADSQGGMVEGRAVLLHRGGDGHLAGPRRSWIAVGRDVSIGVDRQGELELSWVEVDGQWHDAGGVTVTDEPRKPIVLDFRPDLDLVVRIRRRKPVAAQDLMGGLSSLERHLLRRLDIPELREVQPGVATVLFGGERRVVGAVLVREGAAVPTPTASEVASEAPNPS